MHRGDRRGRHRATRELLAAPDAGANEFLLKDTDPAEPRNAIRMVAAGAALLARTIIRPLIDAYTSGHGLTEREFDVVHLVGRARPRPTGDLRIPDRARRSAVSIRAHRTG
ncbi:response regulator transcription factor [Sciscionella marina]|uniref:response regulator transcription factor n=1 Tax=Sciscionella marina TaxID=508770 RepID=UPI000364B604|nr:response regulator transcription factor [Sciscionella marina]